MFQNHTGEFYDTFGFGVFSLWRQGTWPQLILTRKSQGVLGEMKKYQHTLLTAAFTPTLFVTIIDFNVENANILELALRTYCPTERGGGRRGGGEGEGGG